MHNSSQHFLSLTFGKEEVTVPQWAERLKRRRSCHVWSINQSSLRCVICNLVIDEEAFVLFSFHTTQAQDLRASPFSSRFFCLDACPSKDLVMLERDRIDLLTSGSQLRVSYNTHSLVLDKNLKRWLSRLLPGSQPPQKLQQAEGFDWKQRRTTWPCRPE